MVICKRAAPQVHKRLMLIASVAISGPAVGPDRMLGMFLGRVVPDVLALPPPLIFWVLLLGALAVDDVVSLGRVHPATAWGSGAKTGAAVTTIVLARSGGAAAYVEWLEGLGVLAP